MTIAFDAWSHSGAESDTNLSWTHTPAGTPRGVYVGVVQANGNQVNATAVTYGGSSLTQLANSPWTVNASGQAQDAAISWWFLGSSVPTGAQTVSVTVGATDPRVAYCFTVTAAADVEHHADNSTGSSTGTLSLSGTTCFVCQIGQPDGGTEAKAIPTNWTNRDFELVDGDPNNDAFQADTYDIIGSADVTFGYTASAGALPLIVAIGAKEAAASGVTGVLDGDTHHAEISAAGWVSSEGALDAGLHRAAATVAGVVIVPGALDTQIHRLVSEITGTVIVPGTLDTQLHRLASEIAGTVFIPGILDAQIHRLASAISGTVIVPGILDAQLHHLESSISGNSGTLTTGTLAAQMHHLESTIAAEVVPVGVLAAQIHHLTADLLGTAGNAGVLDASLYHLAADITAELSSVGTLASGLHHLESAQAGYVQPEGQLDGSVHHAESDFVTVLSLAGLMAVNLHRIESQINAATTTTGALDGDVYHLRGAFNKLEQLARLTLRFMSKRQRARRGFRRH